ncbi:MAG: SDR family oxidoreductase [Polyangiaceae bacterium]|nr:SDR family oxidoreductase [Polyangiaceae bacterium]
MKIDLHGKLAVVTGGSGQLGRVICRALANCGASVAVNYIRNQKMAEQVAGEVRERGGRSLAIQADVTDKSAILSMKARIEAELGVPDIIVTNAVIQYAWTQVLEQNVADYESQFRSCVLHNVLMAQAFVPAMVERKRGRVIAINTECAMQNFPNQSAYVAGKRGMDGVLRVLAREVGEHQITVNQVAPGWVVSHDVPDGNSEAERGYKSKVPMKRRGTDQDVANLVAFLASDLAQFISGQYISVSGGNVMPAI